MKTNSLWWIFGDLSEKGIFQLEFFNLSDLLLCDHVWCREGVTAYADYTYEFIHNGGDKK